MSISKFVIDDKGFHWEEIANSSDRLRYEVGKDQYLDCAIETMDGETVLKITSNSMSGRDQIKILPLVSNSIAVKL